MARKQRSARSKVRRKSSGLRKKRGARKIKRQRVPY